MRSFLTSAGAALLALAVATPACAQLIQRCSFSRPSDVSFGAYEDGQSAPLHTVTTVEVTCRNVHFNVLVTGGPGENSGDMLDRKLRHRDGDLLRYQLYVDSARTRVWGDGTRGTEPIVLTSPANTRIATIYAEMPGAQGGVEGDYKDSIRITVLP